MGVWRVGRHIPRRQYAAGRTRHVLEHQGFTAFQDFRQKGRLQVWELGASGVRLQAKDRKPRLRSWDIEGAVEGLAQTAIDGQT